jgi:transposase
MKDIQTAEEIHQVVDEFYKKLLADEKISYIFTDVVKIKLEEQFGIKVSQSTTHNTMKVAGFSHITARSVHYKQDKEKLEEFKKNSN